MISKRASRTILSLCAILGTITTILSIKCNETQKEVDEYLDLKGKVEIFRPEVINAQDSVSTVSKTTYNIYKTYIDKSKTTHDTSLYQDMKSTYNALFEIVNRFDSLLIKMNSKIDSLNNLSVSKIDIAIFSDNSVEKPNFFSKFIHPILKFLGIRKSEPSRIINPNKDEQREVLKNAKFILNEIAHILNESDKKVLSIDDTDIPSDSLSSSESEDSTRLSGSPRGDYPLPVDSPIVPPSNNHKLSQSDSLKKALRNYLRNSKWIGNLYHPHLKKTRTVYIKFNYDCSTTITNFIEKSGDTLEYNSGIDYDNIHGMYENLTLFYMKDSKQVPFAVFKITKQDKNRAKFILRKYNSKIMNYDSDFIYIDRIKD